MVSKILASKNTAKQSTALEPKHSKQKTQTQFHLNPTAKHQAVKDLVEEKGYSFPHFQYPTQAGKSLPTAQVPDCFSPSKVKNKDLNVSKPKLVSKAEEVAYVEQLNTRAKELGVAHILDEAMNKAGDKLHASFSTKIPSQESLERTAEAMNLLNKKNIGYTTHTLARVLQDGQAITLMKALKEFCEDRADSSTFLAYDYRFDLNKNKFYNQFNFFRHNSATKQAIQIPLSPPNPKQAHKPKKLKARTVIANHAQQLNNRLTSGNFEILHTEAGLPITTNAQYQQALVPQQVQNQTGKNLADQFTKMDI